MRSKISEPTFSKPVPADATRWQRNGRAASIRQEAISALKPSQSFWISTTISSVCTLRWWASAKYPQRKYVARVEGKGVRVWRIK